MITVQNISDSLLLAEAYYLQITSADIASLKVSGCATNHKTVTCLNRLIRALQWDVDLSFIGVNTIILYDLLLKTISTFSGAQLPFDPHAYTPSGPPSGTVTLPPPIEITTAQMTVGGTRYDNVAWKGFNPFMIVDNTTWLQNVTDYTLLSTGGFILNPSGNVPVIYPGQIIRSLTYQIA